jgi:HlyD family secretion protein
MAHTGDHDRPGANSARVRAAKGRRRLVINLAVVVCIVAAAAYFWHAHRSRPQNAEGIITAQVERRDLVQTVSATGSVTAQTGAMVKIGSQITGRIKQLHADVGDQMKAGEIIAELDVPDLDAQVRQAEATLALNNKRLSEQLAGVGLQSVQSRTDIEKAEAGIGVAQANLRQVEDSAALQRATAQASVDQAQANAQNSAANLARLDQLLSKGYVAAADVDNAKAQADVNAAQLASAKENLKLVETKIQSDLRSAREQLKQAQATAAAAQAGVAQNDVKREQVAQARESVRQATAALALSRAQRDKAYIRTPISGTVLQLSQQQGETIAAGLSAPTLIIVADLDRLQVDAFVDETDIGRIKLGQVANVTVDAYPNHPFVGKVTKIASGATMQQNVVTYDVTIALDNPGHLLKPDMTATAEITVAHRTDVPAVKVDAIKLGTQGSTVTLMTEGKNGQPEYQVVPVTTGASDGEYTEIVSGLRVGDTVVLAGQVPGMMQQQGPRFRGPLGFGGGRGGGNQRSSSQGGGNQGGGSQSQGGRPAGGQGGGQGGGPSGGGRPQGGRPGGGQGGGR